MKTKPNIVIAELEDYLSLYKMSLSEETKRTLIDVEEFASRCDNPASYNIIFSKIIRNTKIVQDILITNNINPNLVALVLEKDYYAKRDDLSGYEKEAYSYSQIETTNEKAIIINEALEYSVRDNRNFIENKDILLAAMDDFEKILEQDNGHWVDNRLNKSDTMLAHLCGRYNKDLWIKFDDIRESLLKIIKNDKCVKIA